QSRPASTFAALPSLNRLTATGLDRASNASSASKSLSVTADLPSLCRLAERFYPGSNTEPVCSMLEELKSAKDRGNLTARDGLLQAVTNAITAQAGKQITGEDAATLIRWIRTWALS